MQVKKFEARTMKEALEMVKSQLGPDAVILSVRDNNRSFGLVGDGSIEITAAVAESTLNKKKFVESKLREQDRVKFNNSSARVQKEVIEKFVTKQLDRQTPRAITEKRYIEIDREEGVHEENERSKANAADERIKDAVKRAWGEFQEQESHFKKPPQNPVLQKLGALLPKGKSTFLGDNSVKAESPVLQKPLPETISSTEIITLKSEIESLRTLVAQFQKVPQALHRGSHPGAEMGIPYELCFIFERLLHEGIDPNLIAQLIFEGEKWVPSLKIKNRGLIEGVIAKLILDKTRIVSQPTQGQIHCFFGPPGSGKTSTLVKFASHLALHERKKIAILTTDTIKVGAIEQLRIYSQILNVPFGVIADSNDWISLVRQLSTFDSILVDFPGLNLRKADDIHCFRQTLPPTQIQSQNHLVTTANSKDAELTEYGRRYALFNYQDVIFTNLDECIHYGNIYNFMINFDVPLHSFGLGVRIPEDFEFATKERVLDLMFKITKIQQQEKDNI